MLILLAIILFLGAVPAHASGVDKVFGKIDLAFVRNEGQVDPKVRFLSRGAGFTLFLTDNEAVMRFTTPKSSAIRMKLMGRNRNARVEGLEALAGTTNYLIGTGSSQRTNVPSFKKVRYSDVYPGIDVEYHGNGRLLEYDFVVKPGSSPGKIRIDFSGIRGKSIDSSGDLVLKTDAEAVVQKKPHVYQNIDGHEKVVEGAYVVSQDYVGFKIGGYDRTKPLIIDPVLVYSTYFGGSSTDLAYGIAVDVQGSVYITGVTTSADFPIASAAQPAYKGGSTDAFVFKLDPTGTRLVYSTFIGGSSTDEGHGIAVDAGGNAYITGFTQSTDFPIVNGFQKTRAGAQEAYFVKLNSAGSTILYSTYLGGSADDRGFGIALDAANNAYITGTTASTNFPTANPYQRNNAGGFADAFVTKIGAAGNLIYSTYVGGIGNDNPLSIAVDGSGAAYVTGWTTSVLFPIVNAVQTKFGGLEQPVGTDDVFVFKLNPAGAALDYSTYLGGTGSDEGTRITVDDIGSAYVTGTTSSINFPTAKPYQSLLSGLSGQDAFVTKLAPDGKSLIFSTYFGGFQTESGTGIAVDRTGAVYIAGFTTSFDLPTANEVQGFIGGDRDAFIAKFDPSGSVLVFSTFLGGLDTDAATGLAIDSAGNVYVTGLTNSGDFKLANPIQPASAGAQDLFVAKLNAEDIVASSRFQVAAQGASSVVTKGTRTDPVFGYATAEPTVPGPQMTGLAIIDRKQNGATVSEVGMPTPPFTQLGRLFVDLTGNTRSVVSIANPNDADATVDFFYTDETGNTSKFATTTVAAHQHFSRFVSDTPLDIGAPGTLNFSSSIPIAATAFFTTSNESSELLISDTPIVDPVAYAQQVGNKPVTLPELAEGGGWNTNVILVNTSEDRMNGEVRFFSQGSGAQPGAPMEVGIGDGSTAASAVEFDIPARSFQKIATAGSSTSSESSFTLNRGTSIRTPGAGPFQVSGWASADAAVPTARLTGLEILEYRQLGVTQSQTGVLAPPLRLAGRLFIEVTDKIRSFIAIANPNDEDVSVDFSLTDDTGTTTDTVTVTVPAKGQYSVFAADAPISVPLNSARSLSFSASLPVFVSALRFSTNERNDSLLSSIPIAEMTAVNQKVVIPHFTDGAGWKTQVALVNNSEADMRGEILFLNQGTLTPPPQGVQVGTAAGTASVFEYSIPARSFYRLETNGLMDALSVGSIQIVPFVGFNTPAAYALIADVVGENTIFQTAVEGQLPASSFRLYAEAIGDFGANKPKSTRTTVTIANSSSAPATVQLELTSFDGARLGTSSPVQIPANGQLAWYLFQFPGLESVKAPFQGTVRVAVVSGSGVTAAGFRVMINERLDYLVTTTGPLNENAGMLGRLVFPYMTDSTGYTTQFILVNPTEASNTPNTSGVLRYLASDGTPLQIDTLRLGSIRVVPFIGSSTPHAHAVLSHREGGILSFETSIEGEIPGTTFRMYAESVGDFDAGVAGSTRSGIALANPSETPATVRLEMRGLNGALLRTSQPVQVPANGQVSLFLNQAPGFETLAVPFEGVLRVVATSPQGITASGFRAIYNERGNVLFTTTGPLSENAGAPAQLVFPHIAEGGGYTTKFIVISGPSGQSNSGVLRFFNQDGNPLNVTLAER